MLIISIIFIALLALPPKAECAAKYVFLFIGDGMGVAQRNAAEIYMAGMSASGGQKSGEDKKTDGDAQLAMNSLPVQGFIRTGSLSGVTDSAASATALATGHKVRNGVISMNAGSGEKYAGIAEIARKKGMKVGIVTSAFLQDATPAAFYGRAAKRNDRYNIGLQLSESGFEYFGGGGFSKPKDNGKFRSLYEIAESKGYAVIYGLDANPPSEKVIAVHPNSPGGYMPWVIDGQPGPSLADFVDYGVKRLYCDDGFFMMVEGGKIDLACHANDTAASIHETIAFDDAVARAIEFMKTRPASTLIVVTSDHETGGMSLDSAKAGVPRLFQSMSTRLGSYAAFERKISPNKNANIDDYMNMAREFFSPSITLTDSIANAFRMSMTPKGKRAAAEPDYAKLYATYDPFTVTCVKAADAAAGITWRTYYHTGKDVPISAAGSGSGLFAGEYENTGVYDRIISAMEND